MTYYTFIDDRFTYPNAPIVIDVGVDVEVAVTNHKFIQQLPSNNVLVQDAYRGAQLLQVTNNIIQVSQDGSYTLLIYTNEGGGNFTYRQAFSFYCYNSVQRLNSAYLVKLIGQELPSIFNANAPYVQAMINGYAEVFSTLYDKLYYLYYNAIESLGVAGIGGVGYNTELEYIYIGSNKFLENSVYPAPLLQTLMNVKTVTGYC
jgi:hypothetical protein